MCLCNGLHSKLIKAQLRRFLDKHKSFLYHSIMATETEKKEEIVYKADPFAFIFRELDLMHSDVREIKAELANVNNNINKRIDDTNKRIDSMADSINKRFDRLYIIVILNLIGITAFLIKAFFF